MQARNFIALGLMLLLCLTPFSQLNLNEIEEDSREFTSGGPLSFVNDVPSWQIDDKWVYETDFDVAGLVAQLDDPTASVNTLGGDTTEEVVDIIFHVLDDGTQHLVYKVKSEGDFTSGNNGAALEGYTGRVDVEYEGEDLIRVSDLATISSSFSIDVEFLPYNIGFLSQDVADITILNEYNPPLEKYDFPVALGENWYVETQQDVDGSGQSDYFEPDEIDQSGAENYSFQVSDEGTPSENGTNILYSGCSNSYKINQWNESAVKTGFEWYCPAVRGKAWSNVYISLGLEIDWMLKEYLPANSSGVTAASNPGARQIKIDVEPQFPAALPNAQETVWGNYSWNGGPNPNTNLQVRWDIDEGIWNINTDVNGVSHHNLSVGTSDDDSPSNDDVGSHGVIIWDPVQKIVGTRTIILDPNVVGIDLAARTDHLLIERVRGDENTFLSEAIGWNAVPGDLLKMSLPAQNLGMLVSNQTELEVDAPDGSTIRGVIPPLAAYQEARVEVNWTVPVDQDIGMVAISYEVDPDGLIWDDANLSNNIGTFEIYIGRLAIPIITANDPVWTFDNVTIDATGSIDPDGGTYRCEFRAFSAEGVEFNAWEDDCIWEFNWSDDGIRLVDVFVIDEENDRAHGVINITVVNRAPWLNVSAPESIIVGEKVTVDASDHGDIDTISPLSDVSISWPETIICEGGAAAHICTFTPSTEGNIFVTATATDDDNETTQVEVLIKVLNRAPSISSVKVFNQSGEMTTLDGIYDVLENEEITINSMADDSANDMLSLVFNWWLDAEVDENDTVTTDGYESNITKSWQSSGLHKVWVEAWDDDSATSERIEIQFMVENVAPTLDALDPVHVVHEDKMVWINATGSDSPSDMESWFWCWDLDTSINSDGNGTTADDCDYEGSELAMAWNQTGLYNIAVTVQDDDGASAMRSTTINVKNRPPEANIGIANGSMPASIVVTIGDSLSLTAENSSDSDSDMATLQYHWDHSGLDGNGDSDLSNDIDHSGMYYEANFDRVGTFTITLTVIDDDGDWDPVFIEVLVEPEPEEGLFAGFMGEDGGTTVGLSILIIFVLLLVVVVMLRRGGEDDMPDVDWTLPPASVGLLESAPPPIDVPSQLPTTTAPLQEATPAYAQTTAYDPAAFSQAPSAAAASPLDVSTPIIAEPASAPQPLSNTPPIPAGGLPAGWTMEQWEHYGEQWLAQNMTASQPAAQSPVQPTQSNVDDPLAGLLDGLDF